MASLTHMFISSSAVLGVFFTIFTKASAPSTVIELYASYSRTKKRENSLCADTFAVCLIHLS